MRLRVLTVVRVGEVVCKGATSHVRWVATNIGCVVLWISAVRKDSLPRLWPQVAANCIAFCCVHLICFLEVVYMPHWYEIA